MQKWINTECAKTKKRIAFGFVVFVFCMHSSHDLGMAGGKKRSTEKQQEKQHQEDLKNQKKAQKKQNLKNRLDCEKTMNSFNKRYSNLIEQRTSLSDRYDEYVVEIKSICAELEYKKESLEKESMRSSIKHDKLQKIYDNMPPLIENIKKIFEDFKNLFDEWNDVLNKLYENKDLSKLKDEILMDIEDTKNRECESGFFRENFENSVKELTNFQHRKELETKLLGTPKTSKEQSSEHTQEEKNHTNKDLLFNFNERLTIFNERYNNILNMINFYKSINDKTNVSNCSKEMERILPEITKCKKEVYFMHKAELQETELAALQQKKLEESNIMNKLITSDSTIDEITTNVNDITKKYTKTNNDIKNINNNISEIINKKLTLNMDPEDQAELETLTEEEREEGLKLQEAIETMLRKIELIDANKDLEQKNMEMAEVKKTYNVWAEKWEKICSKNPELNQSLHKVHALIKKEDALYKSRAELLNNFERIN